MFFCLKVKIKFYLCRAWRPVINQIKDKTVCFKLFNSWKVVKWLLSTLWQQGTNHADWTIGLFPTLVSDDVLTWNTSDTWLWAALGRGCSAASAADLWHSWSTHEPRRTTFHRAPSSLGLSRRSALAGLQTHSCQFQQAAGQNTVTCTWKINPEWMPGSMKRWKDCMLCGQYVNYVWEAFYSKGPDMNEDFTHLATRISGPSVTCMISTIATRSAREILSSTMNDLYCRNFSSSRLSDWFRSSSAASIFSFGTSEPMTKGNRACSKRDGYWSSIYLSPLIPCRPVSAVFGWVQDTLWTFRLLTAGLICRDHTHSITGHWLVKLNLCVQPGQVRTRLQIYLGLIPSAWRPLTRLLGGLCAARPGIH